MPALAYLKKTLYFMFLSNLPSKKSRSNVTCPVRVRARGQGRLLVAHGDLLQSKKQPHPEEPFESPEPQMCMWKEVNRAVGHHLGQEREKGNTHAARKFVARERDMLDKWEDWKLLKISPNLDKEGGRQPYQKGERALAFPPFTTSLSADTDYP